MSINSLLVANRGEIARRVFRTARAMGIRTLAVFSDSDAGSPFVAEADEAVRIGNYLDVEAVVDAARRAGADAVHPGYGFLSENAAFAEAVSAAGLAWVGPSPEVIASMGDKSAAKRAADLLPMEAITSGDGPTQASPAVSTASAKAAFSERNP